MVRNSRDVEIENDIEIELEKVLIEDIIDEIKIENDIEEVIVEEKVLSKKIVKILDIVYGIVIVDINYENQQVKIDMLDFQLGFIMDNKHKYIGKNIEIELENDDVLPLTGFNVK